MRSSTTWIRLVLLAAFTLAAATVSDGQAPSGSGASARELIRQARGSVAIVTGENRASQPLPPGLGFVIGRNLIATNHRVFAPQSRLHANLTGQESPSINVSYSDSYRRATILTMSAPLTADPLTVGDSDKVSEKDRVYLFAGPEPQSEVLEAAVRRIIAINDKRYFELSTPFTQGISGGPVFNDKGEVIGILSENPEAPHISIAVPASYLTVLLKARNPEAVPGAGTGQGSGVKITTGAGQGAGTGGGVGMGAAPSVGPGQPSGGVGAGADSPGGASTAPSIATRPKALNSVRPQYTEIARMNQTMGVVMIRIVVGADGDVKQARVTKGLPDGLNEQALDSAYQLKFQPATRNGVAVTYTLSIQVEFNLR